MQTFPAEPIRIPLATSRPSLHGPRKPSEPPKAPPPSSSGSARSRGRHAPTAQAPHLRRASPFASAGSLKAENELECFIDLKPALDRETLDKRILRDFESNENKEFQNVLGLLLPRLMVPVVVKLSGIDGKRKVNLITHDERMKLIETLKDFPMTIDSLRGMNEAIISTGGVLIKEIDPRTMELKKIKNLKVAGEIIDCDALTGGFNLQIAWSTAFLAADCRREDD